MTTVTTEQSVDIQIGERVHQMLFRKRLSQTKVAPKMGISQSVLSRKLRGEIIWTAEDVLAMCNVTNPGLRVGRRGRRHAAQDI